MCKACRLHTITGKIWWMTLEREGRPLMLALEALFADHTADRRIIISVIHPSADLPGQGPNSKTRCACRGGKGCASLTPGC